MIFEMTVQIRVLEYEQGKKWYTTLFNKEPDFVPHEGFAEWELIPGSWLQVAEGKPAHGSGPLRFGVLDIEAERQRVIRELNVDSFEIHSREEVPVKWGTFSDPWGNQIGFFEYVSETERNDRISTILGKMV
jgi:hypothetical protein